MPPRSWAPTSVARRGQQHEGSGEREILKKIGHPADFIDREGKKWPLGRILKPEEIAEWCLFLASDKAAAFSGQVIELEQFPTGWHSPPERTGPTSVRAK